MARTKQTQGPSNGHSESPDRRRQSTRLRASTSSAPDTTFEQSGGHRDEGRRERNSGNSGNSGNFHDEDTDVDEPVYEVEKIIGKMYDQDGHPSYLIKWKGYNETTWEPAENCDCKNMIEGYEQVIKRANRSR